MADDLGLIKDFTGCAAAKLEQNLGQVLRCARLLSDGELWQRVNAHTNSVGNLILHLTGNVRQWIGSGLGGEPFARDRPAEFAARGAASRAELLGKLEETVQQAIGLVRAAGERQLAAEHTIQGYPVSGLVAVFHVVEHFSWHTGQIVHMTKAIRDVDLSLYDEQGRKQAGAERCWP